MPTISVNKADLYKALGREYSTDEFDELCFDFGIELDEDTTDQQRPIVDGVQEPPQLKIEIPANRYDMLCFEGIALNLNVFLERRELPAFTARPAAKPESITVKPDTTKIRPLVSGGILRGLKFNKDRYDSFIALQDKLHQNLARQRTLVAIGTHDLAKIKGPFTYEALPPEQIKFIPLNQTKEMNAKEMMTFYEKDRHLGRYLPIIRDSEVYPVIYDSNRKVLSMPPIINGDLSKISQNTKDVFIECTATDATKLDIVINMMISMFSVYASEPFTYEPIQIVSEHNKQTRTAPDLSSRRMQAEADYINSCCGLELEPADISKRLTRMGYKSAVSNVPNILDVEVPATRADVLHQADIMEDVAVSYGFNKLPRSYPAKAATLSSPLPLNKLADIIRLEAALAGWSEVLPLILCSHDENFAWLNRKDNDTAVRLANPKTAEYQIVRTSLLPGLLKSIRENKAHALPFKIFEVSDVAYKDLSKERKSTNERHFAAACYGKTSGFELVHGVLDHIMKSLKVPFLYRQDVSSGKDGYWVVERDDPTFLQGHAATINIRVEGQQKEVGMFGILHPSVLNKFELSPFVASAIEMNIEGFV